MNKKVHLTGFIIICIVLIAGYFFNRSVVRYYEKSQRNDLLRLTATASASIDPLQLSALDGMPHDINKSHYDNIKAQLIKIKKLNKDARFVYLMGRKAGKILFLVDAEPPDSEDYSAPGDIYEEASPRLFEIFSKMVPFVEGPFEDQWGEWVSGHAPIMDPQTGNVAAVIGIDISAKQWKSSIGVYWWLTNLVTGLVVLLVITFM